MQQIRALWPFVLLMPMGIKGLSDLTRPGVRVGLCNPETAAIGLMGIEILEKNDWNPGKLETIFLKPDQLPKLSYIPVAVTAFAQNKDAATKYFDYLASAEGRKIFLKWGYAVTEEQVRKYAPKAKIGGEYTLPSDWAGK